MSLSLHTAATVRRLSTNPNLHEAGSRQPFPATEEGLRQFEQAMDVYYPSLDESDADGAQGEKGLVRYHTAQGERLQARYEGTTVQGQYLQEWTNGAFMMTKFDHDVVDNYQVGPRGSHHVHLDRKDSSNSFVTVQGPGYPLLAGEPAPANPPSMPQDAITTPNGIEIGVLATGTAVETADAGEEVLVHYTGWLESGQKFDSSRDKKSPFKFPLGGGRVIKGWDQGVEGMQVGEKRLLNIPAELAYGERARGTIPANSPLLFEVELLATSGEVERLP